MHSARIRFTGSLVTMAVLLAACACEARPPVTPSPPVDPPPNLAPYPDDEPAGVAAGEACALAGRRLHAFGCPEARRTEGMTFPAFCRSRRNFIRADCIAAARSREELRACHVRCLVSPESRR